MVSLRGTCAELARLFSVVVPCVSKLSDIRRISIFNANSIPFLRQRATLRLICSCSPILRLPVSGSPFQEARFRNTCALKSVQMENHENSWVLAIFYPLQRVLESIACEHAIPSIAVTF